MKHIERIRPGLVVFVYVSCRIVVCNVEVYFPLYETELYKPHYKSTNYTYKWHVNCFMKKATDGTDQWQFTPGPSVSWVLIALGMLLFERTLYFGTWLTFKKSKFSPEF